MPSLRFHRLSLQRPRCAPVSSSPFLAFPSSPYALAQILPDLVTVRDTGGVRLGHGRDPVGIHFGSTSDPLRIHLGSTSDPLRIHFGSTSDPLWTRFGHGLFTSSCDTLFVVRRNPSIQLQLRQRTVSPHPRPNILLPPRAIDWPISATWAIPSPLRAAVSRVTRHLSTAHLGCATPLPAACISLCVRTGHDQTDRPQGKDKR